MQDEFQSFMQFQKLHSYSSKVNNLKSNIKNTQKIQNVCEVFLIVWQYKLEQYVIL